MDSVSIAKNIEPSAREIGHQYNHEHMVFVTHYRNKIFTYQEVIDAVRVGITEMSADKAYSSRANNEYIGQLGGTPYIMFKSDATGKAKGSVIWKKMYNFFVYNRDQFLMHYHSRSNIESTNNMIKTKFTDVVRSKDKTAQINEVLLKALCHNLCVLISEMFELGIEPNLISS